MVMESLYHFIAPPSACGYLPDQTWRLEYDIVGALSPAEYMQRMLQGWRRFGDAVFRPRCPTCRSCRSLRVLVDRFRPDRSQRRARKGNEGEVRLEIGPPTVTRAKLDLYDRYHAYQADARGWPEHPAKDAAGYANSLRGQPLPDAGVVATTWTTGSWASATWTTCPAGCRPSISSTTPTNGPLARHLERAQRARARPAAAAFRTSTWATTSPAARR